MTDDSNHFQSSAFNSLKRYVPLAVWVIVIFVIFCVPLRIIQYGYLPGDDALRHAAKAVSGKPWSEILVLNPVYKIDHEFGWNWLLEKVCAWTNWDAERLVIFSVVCLFLFANLSPLLWLKRPEAWLVALMAGNISSDIFFRFTLGRPFLITLAGLMAFLLLLQRHGSEPPKKWMLALATAIFTFCTFFHGVWYLWALLLGAIVFAGEFRWAVALGFCWIIGVFLGSALTGHPLAYPVQAIQLALLAIGAHGTSRTMASELQPFGGNFLALVILGFLVILRQLAKLPARPLTKTPAFWLVCFCWVLAFRVTRFWEDWGWPALMVLIVCDLQLLLLLRFQADSFKRLALTCGLAAACYLCVTSDVNSQWSATLTNRYLVAENPDLKGWMPEHDGIFYTAAMPIFYQTFFKNPHGDWRYILGFEPTWMPKEDFETFYKVLWNFGDSKAYEPWVKKMRSQDRLAILGQRDSPPNIPELEWHYDTSGIWLGRLPHANAPAGNSKP